jgi:transposase
MTDIKKMKTRIIVTKEQKLEFSKLMTDEGYSVLQIMEISGACESAVSRWKRQYVNELKGNTPNDKVAITPEHQRIQELEKQLKRAQRDNEILKKAAAFFILENSNLS